MTTSSWSRRHVTFATLRRWVRTPKGLMTVVLVALAGVAGVSVGFARIMPSLAASALAAALVDAPILRARGRWWTLPDGAILTGLFVAMVLSPFEPWYAAAATSVAAVLGKHAFRGRTANVFNPAALGIVATFYLFGTGQDWWGALADAGLIGMAVLLTSGLFIADRVNKLPLVLVFLGSYFLLFTGAAYAGEPAAVAEIFRPPDINAALFFACFILTDPPTSPIKYRDQAVCGVLVAVASFAIFQTIGAAHYLLSGVLVGNLWEARRRAAGRRPARDA